MCLSHSTFQSRSLLFTDLLWRLANSNRSRETAATVSWSRSAKSTSTLLACVCEHPVCRQRKPIHWPGFVVMRDCSASWVVSSFVWCLPLWCARQWSRQRGTDQPTMDSCSEKVSRCLLSAIFGVCVSVCMELSPVDANFCGATEANAKRAHLHTWLRFRKRERERKREEKRRAHLLSLS